MEERLHIAHSMHGCYALDAYQSADWGYVTGNVTIKGKPLGQGGKF